MNNVSSVYDLFTRDWYDTYYDNVLKYQVPIPQAQVGWKNNLDFWNTRARNYTNRYVNKDRVSQYIIEVLKVNESSNILLDYIRSYPNWKVDATSIEDKRLSDTLTYINNAIQTYLEQQQTQAGPSSSGSVTQTPPSQAQTVFINTAIARGVDLKALAEFCFPRLEGNTPWPVLPDSSNIPDYKTFANKDGVGAGHYLNNLIKVRILEIFRDLYKLSAQTGISYQDKLNTLTTYTSSPEIETFFWGSSYTGGNVDKDYSFITYCNYKLATGQGLTPEENHNKQNAINTVNNRKNASIPHTFNGYFAYSSTNIKTHRLIEQLRQYIIVLQTSLNEAVTGIIGGVGGVGGSSNLNAYGYGFNIPCTNVDIDLYEVFLENKFGPVHFHGSEGIRCQKITSYYTQMSSISGLPIEFLFLRDQFKWYFCYRLHFLIDSFHDFGVTGDKSSFVGDDRLKILVNNFQNEIITLIKNYFDSLFISVEEAQTYQQSRNPLFTDIKADNNDFIMLLDRTPEGINKIVENLKRIEPTTTNDKCQRNYSRWILNDCDISTLPKPWNWTGLPNTGGPDVLSILNHGYNPFVIDPKNIINIYGIDSAGNISRNTDIANIIAAYTRSRFAPQNGNAVVKSIASVWDSGGSDNSIFNNKNASDINVSTGNNKNVFDNLRFREHFHFRKNCYELISLSTFNDHEVLDYALCEDPRDKKTKLLLKKFGNVDSSSGIFVGTTSTKGANADLIRTSRVTDTKNIVGYFMSKLLGDESKINVVYALRTRIIDLLQDYPVILSYWVSNDIIASMSASFKIPGSIIVETSNYEIPLKVKNRDGTIGVYNSRPADFQRWAIRDWCFRIQFDGLYDSYPIATPNPFFQGAQGTGFGKKKIMMIKNKFIQKANARSRRRGTVGSFRRWCVSHGLANRSGKVTQQCITAGIHSRSEKIRRRAQFAKNIGAISTKRNKIGKSKKNNNIKIFMKWCKSKRLLSKSGKITKKCIIKGSHSRSPLIRKLAKRYSLIRIRKIIKKTSKKPIKKPIKKSSKKSIKVSTRKKSSKKPINKKPIKVSTRKSPLVSATKYSIGTKKIGLDKKKWIVKKISNGVKRWVRYSPKKLK